MILASGLHSGELSTVGNHPNQDLVSPLDRLPVEPPAGSARLFGGCRTIISFNKKDLEGAERFGVAVRTPREFLEVLGAVT